MIFCPFAASMLNFYGWSQIASNTVFSQFRSTFQEFRCFHAPAYYTTLQRLFSAQLSSKIAAAILLQMPFSFLKVVIYSVRNDT